MIRTWLREPLLHFVLLGAGLFALDHFIASRAEDPNTIVIDKRSEDDRDSIRREVLYREGIAMQLDKGDPLIRDRVIFKMLSLIETGLSPPTFDEQALRAWFAQNRGKYAEPGSPVDFEQVAPLVLQDWLDAKMEEQRSAAVLSMESRYRIEVSGASR